MKRRLIAWGQGRPTRRLLGHAGLLALGLMLACAKKEVNGICSEICCSADKSRYEYVTELKNAEADFANGGFWLKKPINGINGIIVCPLSIEKVSGFVNTFNSKDIPSSPYAYRISGKIYDNLDDITLSGEPIYDIRLSSAEKIK